MAISNLKKILGCGSTLTGDFASFFQSWKVMKRINKIKANHDYIWYNNYLKASKQIRQILLSYINIKNESIIPKEVFVDYDTDMLQLYFDEISLSHNVTYKLVKEQYIFLLTDAFITWTD
jgi:hypothetical protein